MMNSHRGPLDLVSKLYQSSIWDDVQVVANNGHLRRPLVVEFDPTSFCDLACPECISGTLLNEKRFTEARLVELANEMVSLGVRAVILIGGGEPLLHSGTKNVIRILGEGGVSVGVTTNGTLIHRHLDVLTEFAAWTRVSVDAGSPGLYSKFRPSRSGKNLFDTVIDNMRLLARRKRGRLGFSYLLLARRSDGGGIKEHNFDDILTAGLLAKNVGCDYFEVKPSFDLRHYLIGQPKSLLDTLEAQLSALSNIADDNFSLIYPKNLAVILRQESTTESKNYDRCGVAELRTLITSKGAYVCPYHRGVESRRYGDPTTTSLYDLWNGVERERVTTDTKPSADCQFHCIRHRSNEELIHIGNKRTRRMLEDYDLFI